MSSQETLDRLAGDWWIVQLRRGHRYATDDVLCAWAGVQARPEAGAVLDLGAGTGAVGLLALLRLPAAARLTSVEVGEHSVRLIEKTVAANRLEDRVAIVCGDLRQADLLKGSGRYDLVLANPPYLPAKSATPPADPRRAAARLELHGDVFDYCSAAARWLAPDGWFCFTHAARDPRPERAVERAGLTLCARQEIVFRAGRPPRIAVFTCARTGSRADPAPLIIRDEQGERTATYRAVRRHLWMEE